MGRRKVEIKKIEDKCRRQTTFTKRRQGLFKKAGECSRKCGDEIAIITFSKAGNAYAFGHPCVNSIVKRYLGTTSSSSEKNDFEESGKNFVSELEAKVGEILDKAVEKGGGRPFWDAAIENLDVCVLEKLKSFFEEMKKKLAVLD